MSRQILPNTQPGSRFPNADDKRAPSQSAPSVSMSNPNYLSDTVGSSSVGSAPTASSPDGVSPMRPTYSKRGKITIVACVPCRKRKTKCDGQRPSCSQCDSRRQPCFYDMTDDQRKLTHLRENVEHLQEKSDSLEGLLHTIQTASEEEAYEVFRRLKSGQPVQSVADQVQASQSLSGVGSSPEKHDVQHVEAHSSSDDPWNDARRAVSRVTGAHAPPESPGGRHLDFERLVRVLSLSDSSSSAEIVRRLQNQEGIPSILSHVAQRSPVYHMVHEAMQSQPSQTLENTYSCGDRAFGMVKGADVMSSHAIHGHASEFTVTDWRKPWTNVTTDEDLLEHLIELYFTWQHSFFQNFPEKLFRADMNAGRTKYCSAKLVNAICACGCFLSDRQVAYADRGDGKTLMDSFYEEAKTLVYGDDSSNLTTVSTLCLLSYIEGTKGHITALWLHAGRSVLMATDISLHLHRISDPSRAHLDDDELANEHKARTHAFWGSFHCDATSGFTLGRLPNYNIHGITVELPPVDDAEDEEPWSPYEVDVPHRPSVRSSTFLHCATLSEIVNGTLFMFFAPTSSLSGTLLMEQYDRYLTWYRNLPKKLRVSEESPPHVLSLHMYYNIAVLLLFRPFMKAQIANRPDIVPREVCRESAKEVSMLFALHTKLFGKAGICMFQVHCLLTACTIHIISLPTISATRDFTAACNYFQSLVTRNEWARSSLKILRGLVERWTLILPQEAEEALNRAMPGEEETDHDHKKKGSIGLSATSPSFTLPIDPSSTLDMIPPPQPSLLAQLQQASLSEGNVSNLDPALSSQGQPPPKRQRIMANLGQGKPGPSGQGDESGQEQGSSNAQPTAASYLYSPLENQPVPFLVPVRTKRKAGLTSEQHQRQDEDAAQSDMAQRRTVQEGRPHDGEGRSGRGRTEHSTVEGLSFGDDWRDPFLGFESTGGGQGARRF